MSIVIDPEFSVYKLVDRIVTSSTPLKHRRAMSYISFEIENTLISGKATGRIFSGFQYMSKFIPQMARYKRLAKNAEHVYVFGIPDVELTPINNITYVSLKPTDQLSKEWFAVLHGHDYYTALATQELTNFGDPDKERLFQGIWTFNLDMVSILEEWLTSAVDAQALQYEQGQYNYKRQVELMTASIGNLIQRSNLKTPDKTDTQIVVATELKTEVKESIIPRLQELKGSLSSLQEQEVVVLFSDIRGFTSIAETMAPAELVMKVINPYLNAASKSIMNHGGKIDKFLGDGVLAIFGMDKEQVNTLDALNAASEMLKSMGSILPDIQIGIGITRGKALIDVIGSDDYAEKTIIGDVVNMAQRLSDIGRNEIFLSEGAANTIAHDRIKAGGEVQLKGKSEPQLVYKYVLL